MLREWYELMDCFRKDGRPRHLVNVPLGKTAALLRRLEERDD
jgi:hypothetical protein